MTTENSTFYFFQNQTSNANSTVYQVAPGNNNNIVVKAWGTWGGANVILENMAPGTSASPVWIQLNDLNGNPFSFTTNAEQSICDLIYGENVRAVLSGATGTTSISVSVEFI